ncbi:DmsE family decaheme c-type cytochrome [Kaarinaea lacus]
MTLQVRCKMWAAGIASAFLLTGVAKIEPAQAEAIFDKDTPYSQRGADSCLRCHDEDYDYPVMTIFFTKHGDRNDPRSPMAQFQCESCHGPGGNHEKEPLFGAKRAPIVSFGHEADTPINTQNQICLQCHNDSTRMVWNASEHNKQGMLCTDCHNIHARHDPVLKVKDQAEQCYRCHKQQRAEFERTSVHPVRYDKMQCSQCHNAHGSFAQASLTANTKNTTCYQCHAEKRGPFLWEHAPVSEDCSICHEHHGSIHTPLLKKRVPYLCQQCHSTSSHARNPYSNDSLTNNNSRYIAGKGCLNCHFAIHGSNHPSGVKLTR